MTSSKSQVIFHSFNPYETRFPGRRVISRETLHLIKYLRNEGYTVVVEPEDGSKLNYLTEKGLREFLSDPIYATIVYTSISVITGIIANWLYNKLNRSVKDDEVNFVLEFDEKGNTVRYNHRGQPISESRFQSILKSLDNRAEQYTESSKAISPDIARPFPIYLEHTAKIVGWGNISIDDNGLKVDDAKITDDDTYIRIKNGELKGFSIGGLVYSSTCSICNREYIDCNHISGNKYDGRDCVVHITGIDLAEISIVSEPVQSLAKVKIKKK